MKAIVLKQKGVLETAEVPAPEPAGNRTVLRVLKCGLCRTDAKMWAQGQRDLVLPRILGHEICGVEEKTGKRFTVWPGEGCGTCDQCVKGCENLCPEMKILGFNRDGGLAEKVLVPESSLIQVPEGLTDEIACLTEPMACTLNALDQSGIKEGDNVLIFGGGAVGLMTALSAKSAKARPFIVETAPEKLTKSRQFRTIMDIPSAATCPNSSFDVVINACSSADTFPSGIDLLASGGRFCLFSGFAGEATFSARNINEIHYRQLTVVGAYGCTRDQFSRATKLLNQYEEEARLLIEEEIGLGRTNDAFNKILSGQAFKFIVNVSG